MTRFRAKLWAGVGAAALAGAAVSACQPAHEEPEKPAAAMRHGHVAAEAPAGATGEAGEGGGQALANLAPADALAVRAAFMRGHLAVGMKLVEEGAGREGSAHFLHPIYEVYEPAKAEFEARGESLDEAAFQTAAEAAASGKSAAAVRKLYNGLVHQIEKAAPKAGEYSRATQAKMLMGQLAREYDEGVQGEMVINAVEYQDAYGFSIVLDQLIRDAIKNSDTLDDARKAELQRESERLLNMFPSATPPAKPARPGEVQAQLSRIELAMAGLE